MRSTPALRAALAVLVLAGLTAACDKPAKRPDANLAKPLTVPGAAAPATGAGGVMVDPQSAGLPARPEFPGFYLDRINTAKDPLNSPAVVSGAAPIEMTGFGFDVVAKAPAKGVDLVIDGKPYGAVYGTPRPDVAADKKVPALAATGYHMTLPGGTLAKGPHKVVVRVLTADGSAYYQSPVISFTVD